MQIVWVLDNTEQIHPADSASGVLCDAGTDLFGTATVEILWEYECLQGRKKKKNIIIIVSFFLLHACADVFGADAWQWGFVWACLSLNRHMLGNIRVRAALGILVRYSLRHSGELERIQAHCSNAFSRDASVISVAHHCNRGPMSNVSAPQLDPWSFLPLFYSQSISFLPPPSPSLHTCPFHSLMILVDGDFTKASLECITHRVRYRFQVISCSCSERSSYLWKIADFLEVVDSLSRFVISH